jgi:hypothetical protein
MSPDFVSIKIIWGKLFSGAIRRMTIISDIKSYWHRKCREYWNMVSKDLKVSVVDVRQN